MGVMAFLKILAELALLMCVGSPAAVHYGAVPFRLIAVLAAVCVAVTLSFLVYLKIEKGYEEDSRAGSGVGGKILRFIPFLIPVAVFFILGVNISAAVFCGVGFAFGLYIAITGKYFPDREQQKVIFKIAIAATAVMIVSLLIARGKEISFLLSIFSGLTSIAASVLLMRSLRHESSTYSGMSYQAANIGIMAVFLAAVYGLSRRPVVEGFLAGAKAVYTWLATGVIYVVMLIVRGIAYVFRWLKQLLGISDLQPPPEPQKPVIIENQPDPFEGLQEPVETPQWLTTVFIVLGILIALVILFLIFRAISGRRATVGLRSDDKNSSSSAGERRQAGAERQDAQVRGIRKVYRKYLQWLKKQGIDITPDMTSAEIQRYASPAFGGEAATELREIYINARYNGKETEDKQAERARELFKIIRSKGNENEH